MDLVVRRVSSSGFAEPNWARKTTSVRMITEFSASMDAESGVVVVVGADDGTWTFDVCTNTWARQATQGSPPSERPRLVYDAASDLTYAFGAWGIRTYDVESATWTAVNAQDGGPDGPQGHQWFFMDPPGRTVYSYNTSSGGMTSYDLAANAGLVCSRARWAHRSGSTRWAPSTPPQNGSS